MDCKEMRPCLLKAKMERDAKEKHMDYLTVPRNEVTGTGNRRRHSDIAGSSQSSDMGVSRELCGSLSSSDSCLDGKSGGYRGTRVTLLEQTDDNDSVHCNTQLSSSHSSDNRENSIMDGSEASTVTMEMSRPSGPAFDTLSSHTDEHCSWDRQVEYILACCGFVTNIGCYLQFPQFSVQHGGGVFFMMYLVLVLTCGFPMMYMEMVLGQYARGGPIVAWHVIPWFKGFGVSLVIVSFTIALYSNITIAWTLYHFVISLGSTVPWICLDNHGCNGTFLDFEMTTLSTSTIMSPINRDVINSTVYPSNISQGTSLLKAQWKQSYFYKEVLHVSEDTTISSLGTIQWYIAQCMLVVLVLVGITLVCGPRSLGKLVYMTFCGSHVLILALLVRSCMEDGAISGVKFFLSMKWSALGNLQAWVDAGRLMFTSLGLGTGCLTSLAGYTHFHSHCFRNSLITIIVHCLEMVLAGFITFACLGVHSETLGTQISNLNITSLDLGFSLVPRVLGTMTDKPSVWCGLFFFMMLLLQLDTQSVYVQNVVSAVLHLLKDKWRFRWKFKLSALVTMCLIVLLMGLIFTTQGGIFIYHYLQFSVSRLCLFVLVLFECCSLAWVYGAQRLWNNVADMTGTTDSPWWKLTWRFISPVSILALIILCFLTIQPLEYHTYTYPQWTEYLGWGITFLPTLPLITFLVILLVGENGTLKMRVRRLTRTPRDWGPGPLLNQEPSNDLPDYVICTPDIYKPENALAILTANLYIPNLTNLISVQDADEGEMTNGYLSDLQTVVSSEDSDEESGRGNWSSRLDFVLSCLGYVVGLGNVWRFPYLVFRNGGGAFFIPYLIMLVFVGVPVVYMELAFGQYASLGPVTVWRSVPLFKGIGISMVLATTLISIYYNVVNAWAFHYLFSSMVADLPWLHCRNSWNTQSCSKNMYQFANCSWLNVSMIEHRDLVNDTCTDVLRNCTAFPEQDFDRVGTCITKLRELVGSAAFINNSHINSQKLTSPTEEYFYNKVLDRSGSIGHLGSVQWELALCLLLCWVIVFICLVRGIKTSGKVAYFVVTFPFVIIVVLLVRALTLEGNMQGIRFYVSPKWEKLKEGGVWADAAVQVFFSLSACMGGLVTLASYNKFHNNIYSDAVLICLGDTLMSVLAGFAIFATMGVLSHKLNTDIEDVFKSDIGLTFIVSPAAMSYFPVSPLWSILFFVMIVMLGLSTQFVNIETVITAIIDENIAILRKRRLLVLFVVCMSLFLLGLPLTTQGGIYVLTLMDEYLAGVPIMVNGLFLCVAIGWVYGITKFSTDIKHMIGHTVSYWWKTLWCAISPLIILFILIFSMVGYESLTYKHGDEIYESWSEVLGFILLCIPVISIPSWAVYKLVTTRGSLKQRIKQLCRSENNWGPALEHNWKNVEYYPAVNTNTLSVDIEHSPLHTVTDHVDFTTSGMKVPSLSSQASLLPQPLSPKKPRDMRERAILNHAYSNPQFNHSSEKSTICSIEDPGIEDDDVLIVQRIPKPVVDMCDATTQTEPYHPRSSRLTSTSSTNKSVPSIAADSHSERGSFSVETLEASPSTSSAYSSIHTPSSSSDYNSIHTMPSSPDNQGPRGRAVTSERPWRRNSANCVSVSKQTYFQRRASDMDTQLGSNICVCSDYSPPHPPLPKKDTYRQNWKDAVRKDLSEEYPGVNNEEIQGSDTPSPSPSTTITDMYTEAAAVIEVEVTHF